MSKNRTPLWRNTHLEVKMYKTPHIYFETSATALCGTTGIYPVVIDHHGIEQTDRGRSAIPEKIRIPTVWERLTRLCDFVNA